MRRRGGGRGVRVEVVDWRMGLGRYVVVVMGIRGEDEGIYVRVCVREWGRGERRVRESKMERLLERKLFLMWEAACRVLGSKTNGSVGARL